MIVSLIVARSENGVIGRDGGLPWHLSADLRRFRRLTTGHAIIMGRKTWESIGRPLPDRKSIVLTRNKDYCADGAAIASTLNAALQLAADDDGNEESFIIGGAEIYRLAMPKVDRVYLTLVHMQAEGDVYLPELDADCWIQSETIRHAADEKNPHAYSFITYHRAPN